MSTKQRVDDRRARADSPWRPPDVEHDAGSTHDVGTHIRVPIAVGMSHERKDARGAFHALGVRFTASQGAIAQRTKETDKCHTGQRDAPGKEIVPSFSRHMAVNVSRASTRGLTSPCLRRARSF